MYPIAQKLIGALPLLPLLALVGCRLEIVVPEGGQVTSSSGNYDCPVSTSCETDIEDENFSETFIATPNSGYRFTGWADGVSNACRGATDPCVIDLAGLPPTLRRSALASDAVARLEPIFERIGNASYSVAGKIGVLNEAVIDVDTNNTENNFSDNDTLARAQTISNPATVAGYLNAPLTGADGATFLRGDLDDVYAVEASAGQVVTLFPADYVDADLDLYLYNGDGELVDFSAGAGDIEQVLIPVDGTWFLNPYLYRGASNYLLTIGSSDSLISSHDMVAGEVLVTHGGETVLRQEAATERRRALRHRFGLIERGGGLARARRLLHTDSTAAMLELESGSRHAQILEKLSSKPRLRDAWTTRMLAKAILADPSVAEVTPNFIVSTSATTNDSFINFLWHYDLINVPAAWDITTGAPGVTVAVVDTGIIADHPDIQGQLGQGYDFISDASNAGDGDGIDPDPTDEGEGSNAFRSGNFHGLHVSGTVAARGNNNRGIAGVAYDSTLMPLRALGADDSGTTYDIIQAVRYAAGLSNDSGLVPSRPADIINLSLGGGSFSTIEQNLYNALRQRGVLVVAASGNDGSARVDYPAAYDHVFAVGATDAQGRVTDYSNRGTALDIAAPGGRAEADLNGDGQPDGVLSTYYTSGIPEYAFLEGTSMATPHVAGVFALMRAVNSDLDTDSIDALLRAGALTDDLGVEGRDNSYGYGLINARKAVLAALGQSGTDNEQPPQLGLSSNNLNFGSNFTAIDVIVSNLGGGELSVSSASTNSPWLSVSAANADDSGLGTWTVSVDRSGLADGSYQGQVTFMSDAGNGVLEVSQRVDGGTEGDIGTVYILFIDADTQEVVSQAITSADSDYEFQVGRVPEGRYEVWAGTDTDNDFFICDEGETCGAFQTLDSPVILDLSGDTDDLTFSSDYQISLPSFSGSNLTLQPVNNSDLSWPRLN